MIKKLVIAAVLFQMLALLVMIAQREYIIHNGKEVYLKTAPIDPRDIFRGDYVRLDYTFLTVPLEKAKYLPKENIKKGQRVYAVLKESALGVYSFDYLTGVQPDEGVFIAGRINQRHYSSNPIRIKYGIEKYFLEQDAGLALEKARGKRNDYQRPMEIKVAISDSGTAIIKDFRWSPLSMKLTVERQERDRNRNRNDPPLSPILNLGLKNASGKPVSILNVGDQCIFQLETDERRSSNFIIPDHSECMGVTPGTNDVITLAPDEEFMIKIDLNRSRWHVIKEGIEQHMAEIDERQMYRISYNTEAYGDLQKSIPDLWLGKLPSQAFNSIGRID